MSAYPPSGLHIYTGQRARLVDFLPHLLWRCIDTLARLCRLRGRNIRKMESMVQYHLARMPMYGAHESVQYESANKLRDNIKAIGARHPSAL